MPVIDDNELRKLLADETITALTVDTNIFDEKRLQLNSMTLQALARLRDRPFHFVLSDTVAKEVTGHLEAAATEAIRSAKKGVGQALHAFETKEPTRDQLLEQITAGKSAQEVAKERFSQYVEDTGCDVLDDAVLVDIATIFDAYFASRAPFKSGKKKDEFPDALALNALERTAGNRDTGILVVSKDSDWKAFCLNSERLYLVSEIERGLALVANAPPVLRKSILDWLEDEDCESQELRRNITDKIEDMEFSAGAIPSSGRCEVYASAGELKGIAWPPESEIDIIDFEPIEDEKSLRLVVSLLPRFLVRIPVEVIFFIWDGIDKELVSMGGRTIDVDEEISVQTTITMDINRQGTADEEIVYVDIEFDAEGFEIDLGEIDVFEPEDIDPIDD